MYLRYRNIIFTANILLYHSVVSLGSTPQNNATKMSNQLPKIMRAVGLYRYLPISDPNSLLDLEVSLPEMKKTDVLVQVKAISVNPIDTKIRAPKPNVETSPRILGWDGSGVVVDRGEQTKHFNIGDEVFFTGELLRNGCNAQYVAVDEIQVGKKPKKLTFEEAASVPLTAVTAYESLYDRLLLTEKDKGRSILIINSAGGVGSMASQLAKNLGLHVIGTASREETMKWSLEHGCDAVLNHTKELLPQLDQIGHGNVDYILVNFDPYPYWDTLMLAIKPQGRICLVVDSSGLVDLRKLKEKSVTLVSEMMGTRMRFDTEDKYRQHEIIEDISRMIDDGRLKCALTKTLTPFNAATMKEAHRLLEAKRMIGKLVVTGF